MISAINISALQKLFPAVIGKKLPREIGIVMVSEQTSLHLNRRYRKKNKPTNVLSFRYDAAYGELVLCREVIRQEARVQGNSFKYQMTWMLVHGMLHLAGVHHEASARAQEKFERIERRVLEKCLRTSSSVI